MELQSGIAIPVASAPESFEESDGLTGYAASPWVDCLVGPGQSILAWLVLEVGSPLGAGSIGWEGSFGLEEIGLGSFAGRGSYYGTKKNQQG